jgi:hypothetical protein
VVGALRLQSSRFALLVAVRLRRVAGCSYRTEQLAPLVLQELQVATLQPERSEPCNLSEANPCNLSEANPCNLSAANPCNLSAANPCNVSEANPCNVSEANPAT